MEQLPKTNTEIDDHYLVALRAPLCNIMLLLYKRLIKQSLNSATKVENIWFPSIIFWNPQMPAQHKFCLSTSISTKNSTV